jgi:hypothetical protein
MWPDVDGFPQIGDEGPRLGVRTINSDGDGDVAPDAAGSVHPGGGGMSVTVDDLKLLPGHRKPKWLGGKFKGLVFMIDLARVPKALNVVQQGPEQHHFVFEPANIMSLVDLRHEVVSTRPDWNIYPRPHHD